MAPAARPRSAAPSIAATTAARSSTAITPAATGTVLRARRIGPGTGSSARGPGYCRAIITSSHNTFTLPQQLRAVARAHQKQVYAALLREAAASVQTPADDRQWVGGTLGIPAVLHTWSRTLEYHPHAHLLVTAGGLTPDGAAWVTPAHPRFLMPGDALSQIFRAKMRAALVRAGVDREVDPQVWQRAWAVHIQPIGSGEHATRYLARYVYRVALTTNRLERFEHGRAIFHYTHARTHETRRLTLPVAVFLARFLQHVLPRGFTKIRSYGLLRPTGRPDPERARTLLALHAAPHARSSAAASETTTPGSTRHDTGTTIADVSGVPLDPAHVTVAIIVTVPATRACSVCGRG